MKIVLPRAMGHFYFGDLWVRFLTELGHEVVVAPFTDRDTLEAGARACIADLCLPVKALIGQIEHALDLGEALWIPRLVSTVKERYFCPKFLALPDLVRTRFPGARILTAEMNAKKGADFTRRQLVSLARQMGAPSHRAERALDTAEKLRTRTRVEGYERFARDFSSKDQSPRIAVIGHPYVVEDDYISSGVKRWLLDQGARVATYEQLPTDALENTDPGLFRDVYWEGSHSLVRAAVHFLGRQDIDGIILVSAFGCGPDSFVTDLVGRRARKAGHVPYTRLLVDEHTAREGLLTRLEAFLDMVEAYRARK